MTFVCREMFEFSINIHLRSFSFWGTGMLLLDQLCHYYISAMSTSLISQNTTYLIQQFTASNSWEVLRKSATETSCNP